jgi:outer membrane murein-binding lipoprotein Lpp
MRMRKFAMFFVAAMSVAALVAGCSSTQKDQALATDIKAKMFSDPQVKAASVDVAVKNGEATLSGEVPDDGVRYAAFKIATDTPGVKHVVDKMVVQTAQAAPVAEPAPVEPPAPVEKPRSTQPARREAKHHADSNVSSKNIDPAPVSVPAPVAAAAPAEQPVAAEAPPPPPPPPPPQPTRVEIPAGTGVRVQMIDGVDSSVNHAGEMFHASLVAPIVVDSQIVVPAGTDAYLKLVNAKSAGHMTGQSTLALELVRMEFQGKSYALASSEYTQTGSSRGKRTAETVGGGAVIGTLLGAVIGGGKGAAIGAATGAGAGGVAEGVTKGQQVRIPSETKLDFTLDQPVEVSYFPDKNRSPRH